jgi:hypothetical protein
LALSFFRCVRAKGPVVDLFWMGSQPPYSQLGEVFNYCCNMISMIKCNLSIKLLNKVLSSTEMPYPICRKRGFTECNAPSPWRVKWTDAITPVSTQFQLHSSLVHTCFHGNQSSASFHYETTCCYERRSLSSSIVTVCWHCQVE